MPLKIIFPVLFLAFSGLYGQKNITVNGYITDASSGEKLINANVYSRELNIGTTSNVYGFYSITVPARQKITLSFTYVGYESKETGIQSDSSLTLDISLDPSGVLKEVVVASSKERPLQENVQMSRVSLPMNQIKSIPALMGEVDVLKALQLLPGVQGGTEGSAGLYVRGGGPDQNLYLLDGVPVYNVNHLAGFFSTFNADAISNVDLYKGGFPARFGGRLSSVVDIRMKEGNKTKFSGEGGIGLLSAKLLLEGPLNKGKGSYIISGRRTYLDALMAPLVKASSGGEEKGGYFFYDLNAKANYKISARDHIYLSGYFGKDKLHSRSIDKALNDSFSNDLYWGNLTGVFRWNRIFTPKIFGNLSASYSSYDFNTELISSSVEEGYTNTSSLKLFSGIRDLSARYDLDYLPNSKHTVRAGISATHQTFRPTTNSYQSKQGPEEDVTAVTVGQDVIKGLTLDAYAEDEVTLTPKLKANAGLRLSTFTVQNSFYTSLQPRISTRYMLGGNYSLKASYVHMQQFINLLSFDGIGLPTDLWVPVTDKLKPQRSHQVALGLSGTLKAGYELSFETYYKDMRNVIDYKDGSSYMFNTGSYEDHVEMGRGLAYGGEAMIQKKEGRLQGMISYTLSWSRRKYETINRGEWFYNRFDRRHDLKISAVYRLSPRVELSGSWLYNTGAWATLPITQYPGMPPENYPGPSSTESWYFYYYGYNDYIPKRNNYRMDDYHRLDLGLKISKQKKKHERSWAFGAYNVYGRKNPFFFFPENTPPESDRRYVRQFSLFGFPVPYVTYTFKF